MPIPAGVETVTVTSGEPLTLPDGTIVRGHIRFIAPDLAVVPSDDYTLGGEAVAELVNGEFSIELVPQDATGISPTSWSYTIIAEFVNAPGWTRYSVLSKQQPNVVLADILDATSTEPALPTGTLFQAEAVKVMGLDTGVLWGADLNDSATVGSVDLAAGAGIIVDYLDNEETPGITLVTVDAQTVAISDLVSPVTWLMVDSDGDVVQQTTRPTNSQRRTHLQIGAVVVSSGDIIIEQTLHQILSQPLNQVYDLMDAIGAFNISGNRLSPAGANLQLAKETGTVFARGFNHFANDAITNDPHVSSVPAQNPVTMRYVTQLPQAPVATVTSVSPGFYDVGGTITAVPGPNARSTIQRVFLFPENEVSNQIVIQYGQTVYTNLDDAVAAINTTAYVKNPVNELGILIGYVVAQKNATDLSNSSQARVIAAARFSENPAGVSSTLALALALTGGTMTGFITLHADPTAALHAATKQYVDAGDDEALKLTGNQSASGLKTFTGGVAVTSGIGTVLYADKDAATPRDTTVTPTADPDLVVTLEANATYTVECVTAWTSGGGGFRVAWSAPSGASMTWTDNDGVGAVTPGQNVTFSTGSGTTLQGRVKTGASAGTLSLLWAQNTSNASATQLREGSYLLVRRVE
jgi:hypothetical protein